MKAFGIWVISLLMVAIGIILMQVSNEGDISPFWQWSCWMVAYGLVLMPAIKFWKDVFSNKRDLEKE